MRIAVLKLFLVAPFALALGACNTTGILAANEPAHVAKINVSLAPTLTESDRFSEMLRAKTTQDAARFGRAGAAKEVRISVLRHSYKNPAASLLIGDANYAGAKVAVVDVATGRVQGEAEASALDSLAINGVVGAIIAAAQDRQKVDQRLADILARDALTKVYGSSRAAAAYQGAGPAAEPAPAQPEPSKPGAAPKPATKPAGTPVAASPAPKDRQAMAAPASAPTGAAR